MKTLNDCMRRLAHEEDGAAASEYAVLVAFIVAAVAAAVALFDLEDIFGTVSGKVITLINGA
jgi:Flp pilus assembly pilin Flp